MTQFYKELWWDIIKYYFTKGGAGRVIQNSLTYIVAIILAFWVIVQLFGLLNANPAIIEDSELIIILIIAAIAFVLFRYSASESKKHADEISKFHNELIIDRQITLPIVNDMIDENEKRVAGFKSTLKWFIGSLISINAFLIALGVDILLTLSNTLFGTFLDALVQNFDEYLLEAEITNMGAGFLNGLSSYFLPFLGYLLLYTFIMFISIYILLNSFIFPDRIVGLRLRDIRFLINSEQSQNSVSEDEATPSGTGTLEGKVKMSLLAPPPEK